MTIAHTPCNKMATTGTLVRAAIRATPLKKTPSWAIAKYTRGAVSIDWPRKPNAENAIPAAISDPPRGPRRFRITVDAGVIVAARPAGPSSRTYTKFTDV